MTLQVCEIFYSLQGEGYYTGTAAVFLRLAGCNLRCPFCDTDHSRSTAMSVAEVVSVMSQYELRHAVITGGEPSLQLTDELIDALHHAGFYIQVETNGTSALPPTVDWVTCSPKGTPIKCSHIDELKLVFGSPAVGTPADYDSIAARERFLQPCDTGDRLRNSLIIEQCVDYIKHHPQWRLSLQTHKLINIP